MSTKIRCNKKTTKLKFLKRYYTLFTNMLDKDYHNRKKMRRELRNDPLELTTVLIIVFSNYFVLDLIEKGCFMNVRVLVECKV